MSLTSNTNNFHNVVLESKHDQPDTIRIPDTVGLRASPRNCQGSLSQSHRLGPSRFMDDAKSGPSFVVAEFVREIMGWLKKQPNMVKRKGGNAWHRKKRVKGLLLVIALVGLFFLVNWFMFLRLQDHCVGLQKASSGNSSSVLVQGKVKKLGKWQRQYNGIYEGYWLWQRGKINVSQKIYGGSCFCLETMCRSTGKGKNGYIMVTANGRINQQRVAVIGCMKDILACVPIS